MDLMETLPLKEIKIAYLGEVTPIENFEVISKYPHTIEVSFLRLIKALRCLLHVNVVLKFQSSLAWR